MSGLGPAVPERVFSRAERGQRGEERADSSEVERHMTVR